MRKLIKFTPLLLIILAIGLFVGCTQLDPYPEDAYFGDIYTNGVLIVPGGGAAHDILSVTHSDSAIAAVSRGSLITGQGIAPEWTELVAGGAGTYLQSDGTDIAWGALVELDPLWSGSPSFGITALDIAGWNAIVGSQWTSDATGIHYDAGNVGINTDSGATTALSLFSGTGSAGIVRAVDIDQNSASAGAYGIDLAMAGGKTADVFGYYVHTASTSNTDNIEKYGVFIQNDGVWTGANAVNYDLYLQEATGGTLNFEVGSSASLRLTTNGDIDDYFTFSTAANIPTIAATGAAYLAIDNATLINGNLSIGGSNNELRYYEGVNYVGFEAPALAGDQIWVLPDADGGANEVLTTDGAGNLSWAAAGGGMVNPMTTLGDIIYEDATPAPERLAGDTSNTNKFLRSLSIAGVAQAPSWQSVSKTDVGLSAVENTALSTWAGSANITTLGTISSGIWNGTDIAVADGGTGLGTIADGSVLATNAADTLSAITWHGAGTKVLTNTSGTISWEAAAAGGATTALDNLASVAINTSLISDTDVTDDLGTGDIRWKDIYAATLNAGLTAADTLILQGRDVNGASWIPILTITSADTVTADLNTIITLGGQYIYRAGGTDIPPADGGTGVSNGANNTITFTGNFTLGLTLSNNTSVTLPTTGTLATLAGAETLTGKVSYNGLVITADTGAITTGSWHGTTIAPEHGGTGVANNAASTLTITGNFSLGFTISGNTSLTLPTSGTLMTNPMTTLGDLIYGAASGAPTLLAGNTTATKKYLTQTGDGANSAAPVWDDAPTPASTILKTIVDIQVVAASTSQTTCADSATYYEPAGQGHLTTNVAYKRYVAVKVSAQADTAGTITISLWDVTTGASLYTTTVVIAGGQENVEKTVASTSVTGVPTTAGDVLTIKVKHSVNGAKVTLNSGGIMEADLLTDVSTTGNKSSVNQPGAYFSPWKYYALSGLSTAAATIQPALNLNSIAPSYPTAAIGSSTNTMNSMITVTSMLKCYSGSANMLLIVSGLTGHFLLGQAFGFSADNQ
jgi:hypothetical protein